MTRVFTVIANSSTPASVTIPDDAYGFIELEIIPPVGHAWTQYDPDAQNGVARSTDYGEKIHRAYPFIPSVRVAKVLLDTGTGTFLCVLK